MCFHFYNLIQQCYGSLTPLRIFQLFAGGSYFLLLMKTDRVLEENDPPATNSLTNLY
jgi:hypothetical protein